MTEARKFLMQASQLDASYYMPHTNVGYLETVNAQLAIQQGQSPGAYFDAARKEYLKSIERNKEEPETYRSMAYVYRKQAEWEIQQNHPAQASITKGLEWIEKSLKMGGENPDGLAIQGPLFLLQAKAEKDSAQLAQYAVSAATALEKGIRLNSLLRQEYEPLLKEARGLQRNP